MAISKKLRFEVFKRDGFRCTYCGRPCSVTVLQLDHVIPRKDNGADTMDNLTTSCVDCNQGKGTNIIQTDDLLIPKGERAEPQKPEQNYICEGCGTITGEYPRLDDAQGKHHLCNECMNNWKKEYARKTRPYFEKMYDDMVAQCVEMKESCL